MMFISIHALLAESDLNAHLYYHSRGLFLSTLSLRRATVIFLKRDTPLTISIHALLAESDTIGPPSAMSSNGFLSTLSLRRATYQQTAYFF